MATDSPQRAYRAACPNCGAPVDFRSAASPMAVCTFCRSTLLREGEALRRIGQAAELFDDHSPLQLGAQGKLQGAAFTLVGRIQMRYADGAWNEWHALFDSGRSGWLSEDNGNYVFSFDAPRPADAPELSTLRAGQPLTVGGQRWSVGSVTQVTLHTAEGELPQMVVGLSTAAKGAGPSFVVTDLRNTQGEVATLDNRPTPTNAEPQWSVGRSITLAELSLVGLKNDTDKSLKGQGVECPSCGASLEPRLSTTQSIVCGQCHAVVDVSKGVGADLAYYAQDNADAAVHEPQLPLGKVGKLTIKGQTLPWQVVGYVERIEVDAGGDGDWQSAWREYLLYNRTAGFLWLVDAEDGWSWTQPLTGVPVRKSDDRVELDGVGFHKLYGYSGQITYVLGEFYWRLAKNQRTYNTDYQGIGGNSGKRLNREETHEAGASEVVWSAGETLQAAAVAQAFGLGGGQQAALTRDGGPSNVTWGTLKTILIWLAVIVVLLLLIRKCGGDDCDEVRDTYGAASTEYQQCQRSSSGGHYYGNTGSSWGGYSSGGGHK
ncbi:DUF4178 domain-containing protein [Aquabacterium sp.]|uniref:DUF4178 domain-containing protein n=1 Tax=Aquabacterium sp. TaxID=1872578 RepID=UPI0035AD7A17